MRSSIITHGITRPEAYFLRLLDSVGDWRTKESQVPRIGTWGTRRKYNNKRPEY